MKKLKLKKNSLTMNGISEAKANKILQETSKLVAIRSKSATEINHFR